MRVLVCGGRNYSDQKRLDKVLSDVLVGFGITELIHGDATGADRMAGMWAFLNGIPVRSYPADWEKHGRRAGIIRNELMYVDSSPEMGIIFPGGNGTAHMLAILTIRGCALILQVQ